MTWKITLAAVCLLAGVAVFYLSPKPQPLSEPENNTTNVSQPKPEPRPIIREPIVNDPIEVEPFKEVESVKITQPEEEQEPLIPPPEELDNSDSQVLKVIANIAPKLSTWLITEQQIRKWVLTIDLLAGGELPKKYPPINFPMTTFKIAKSGEQMITDDANYIRTVPLINAITEIDPKLIARYYKYWQPTLEAAYREQGKPGSFDQRLRSAISKFLSSEQRPDNAKLNQTHVFYKYTDPNYEKRSDLEKFMWRIGPENSTRVQDYLKQLLVHI